MTDELSRQEGDLPSLVDQARVRDMPGTRRGLRTREALVAAARRVFERDGFIESRLVDITAEAKCSTGTFYTYFDSKTEIFTAVMQAAQDDMMNPGMPHVDENPGNTAAILAAGNRAYLEAYRRNAKLMLLLEQVATIDPVFRQLRLTRSQAFAERSARRIAWLQRHGYADPTLDPVMAARALAGMTSRMAYYAWALEEGWDLDEVVGTVTQLWLNALGVAPDKPKSDS
ncbi:TetR family transcriptional regulator [Amycolatopsis sulphurea]|uniref:TetR family transcriptional regulator n=1 Tax=Amycolatopsis sulphurea TaxID=76022 RepID=A0A2A9FKL2_9PSEU|nr:TetR/AcrR family transcriptional regulator [Amycolatopsis sulphurea]PFG51040.1 TetR family transcriptional regulator [Amycolatopsis sulphurea]